MRATRTSRTIQRIAYDRWVRALGLLLLVAACGPSGLTIEVVVDDPAIVKVELYAGRDCGSECPRVTAPPGLAPMSVDDAFVIDDPRPFIVEARDFSGGVAGFRIETGQDTSLAILVAVGYDAQGDIRWSWSRRYVEIPSGDAQHWEIHLAPTTAITPLATPQAEGTERAAQWPNPSGGPACLLLEHWDHNFIPTRDLLGPVDDRDCDGVAELLECAPWIPNAYGAAPSLEATSCVTPKLLSTGANVCMLGGPQCTEDPLLPRSDCVPVDPSYCTPSSLCQCKDSPDVRACLAGRIAMDTAARQMPFVSCVIHVDDSGNQCDASELEIDLGAILSSSSAKCSAMQLNDSDMGLQFNYAWHIGEAKLYIESFTTPCKASVKWEGGSAPLVNAGLLDAEIDNGYHLLLPVVAEIKPGCTATTPSACTYVETTSTAETMFACVGAPVMTGACAPEPDAGCTDGPKCNGTCCNRGEVCGPQGCSCAGGPRCGVGDACEARLSNQCGEACCGVTPCPF